MLLKIHFDYCFSLKLIIEELKKFTLRDLFEKLSLSDELFEQWLKEIGLLRTQRICECGKTMRYKWTKNRVNPKWQCTSAKIFFYKICTLPEMYTHYKVNHSENFLKILWILRQGSIRRRLRARGRNSRLDTKVDTEQLDLFSRAICMIFCGVANSMDPMFFSISGPKLLNCTLFILKMMFLIIFYNEKKKKNFQNFRGQIGDPNSTSTEKELEKEEGENEGYKGEKVKKREKEKREKKIGRLGAAKRRVNASNENYAKNDFLRK